MTSTRDVPLNVSVMPYMSKVAMDKSCAIKKITFWSGHKTQDIYPVVQAFFFFFFDKKLRFEKL